jgi:hypothetical protein
MALLAAVPAAATEQRVVSQPNGDFALFALIRSDTDKDRDGNQETATQPDTVFVILDICRRFDEEQIAEVTYTLDRPGTEFDERFTRTADLVTFSCVGGPGRLRAGFQEVGLGPVHGHEHGDEHERRHRDRVRLDHDPLARPLTI